MEDEEENHEESLGKANVPSTSYRDQNANKCRLAEHTYGVGLRATAAITTAALMDAGLITEDDKRIVVDYSKVRWVKEKLMKSLDQNFDDLYEKGGIGCTFIDGRY